MRYQDINAYIFDRWAEEGWQSSRPLNHQNYQNAVLGNWQIRLTPGRYVPRDWFPPLQGLQVLGLASGGGQQMPVFAAQGAVCTVLDYSEKQLENDRLVAQREHYEIRAIRADMSQPLPFEDESFDLIFHPLSNCYIRDVEQVWQECWRILKPGGILMSGLDNGINFIFGEDQQTVEFRLPFDPLWNPEQMDYLEAHDLGIQFSHPIEEQIGGQLRAGFILKDIYEDTNGSGFLHEHGVPTFWATLSQKPAGRN
jgi:SAM-dependent methyltransferase